jgi:hypothetical protein
MTSPDFTHAPPPQPFPASGLQRFSMLAYGGTSPSNGFELLPLEVNYCAKDNHGAIAKCRFEAGWQKRTHVKVRDPFGAIIFDGLSEYGELCERTIA